jgi:hypothetical protein
VHNSVIKNAKDFMVSKISQGGKCSLFPHEIPAWMPFSLPSLIRNCLFLLSLKKKIKRVYIFNDSKTKMLPTICTIAISSL